VAVGGGVHAHWCNPWVDLLVGCGNGIRGGVQLWWWLAGRGSMEVLYLQIRFWKVTSRIFNGVKSVGGSGERADPAGGDWIGVK
jgi:hypothetical protein